MSKKRPNPFGETPGIKIPKFPEETTLKILDERYRKEVESFVKKHLRRASLQWSGRNKAIISSRVARGLYRCPECPPDKLWGQKEIQLDHKEPVQPVGREIPLMEWIYRLLCPAENFQTLCREHHEGKTQAENMLRQVRKLLKPKKKTK